MIGTQEAIYNGVPIIGIPIYADQYNNLLQAEEKGFGKILLYQDISEEYLETLVLDALNNDSYKKKALEMSQRFKDRPTTPLETAMFWLEYLIRNNNAEHFKNPAMKLSWIEYMMIDVFALVLLIMMSIIYLVIKSISILKLLLVQELQVKISKKNN